MSIWIGIAALGALSVGLSIGCYVQHIASVKARVEADGERAASRAQLNAELERVREMKARLDALQSSAVVQQKEINLLNEAAGRAQALGSRIDDLKSAVQEREHTLGLLRSQLDEQGKAAAESAHLAIAAQINVTALQEKAAELADALKKSEQRREELSEAAASLQDDRARLDTSLVAVRERNDQLESSTARLTLALDDERSAKVAANETVARLGAELGSARSRIEEMSQEASGLRQRIDGLSSELDAIRDARTRLESEIAAQRDAAEERLSEQEAAREQIRLELQTVASRLVEEKGQAMLAQNRAGLEAALAPVREKLKEFEAKVEDTHEKDVRDRVALSGHLEQLHAAQERLHKDADALAKALTGDSKAQGDWGELMLERVLETAGLREGFEYALQVSHRDEDGARKRPDALVYLPDNRAIIVDAKCSLTAFVTFATSVSDEERASALKAHLQSVRTHVKALSGKNYQDVLKQRTLDVVLLFVPNEAAFHAAISNDSSLYHDAFRQSVVICSPTTLLAALQLISHVWRSEKQNRHAQAIAEEAGKLVEKLNAFMGDLENVGERLGQAQRSFDKAAKKLRTGNGNVVKRAQDIVALGARVRPEKAANLQLPVGADLELDDVFPDTPAPEAAVEPAPS